jgi:hypothetical protein
MRIHHKLRALQILQAEAHHRLIAARHNFLVNPKYQAPEDWARIHEFDSVVLQALECLQIDGADPDIEPALQSTNPEIAADAEALRLELSEAGAESAAG